MALDPETLEQLSVRNLQEGAKREAKKLKDKEANKKGFLILVGVLILGLTFLFSALGISWYRAAANPVPPAAEYPYIIKAETMEKDSQYTVYYTKGYNVRQDGSLMLYGGGTYIKANNLFDRGCYPVTHWQQLVLDPYSYIIENR